jgi:hypothetical protein
MVFRGALAVTKVAILKEDHSRGNPRQEIRSRNIVMSVNTDVGSHGEKM